MLYGISWRMNLGERLIDFFREGGVIGLDPARYLEEYRARVVAAQGDRQLTILVAEGDPARFLAALAIGFAAGARVVVASSRWRAHEWRQVDKKVLADIIFGNTPLASRSRQTSRKDLPTGPCLAIPTGGTSGQVRFAVHDEGTLGAAARGFHQWQQEAAVVCWSGLPFHHVSGLMPVVRAVLGNGRFAWTPGIGARREVVSGRINVISLVPTQLSRALDDPGAVGWLGKFSTILIGGAAIPAAIRRAARSAGLPLSPSYGMTETAAAVCALRPTDFLSGDDSSGSALPHGEVTAEGGGRHHPERLYIKSQSLFRGYWGDPVIQNPVWPSEDLGFLDAAGRVYVTGRIRPIINSGGEKIDPTEVERVLIESGLAKEAHVLGTPDSQWGECVTAIFVPGPLSDRSHIGKLLAPHKIPKRWLSVSRIPRNAQGKLDTSGLSL
jgi:o-succinylbenzoate---CoA ligase